MGNTSTIIPYLPELSDCSLGAMSQAMKAFDPLFILYGKKIDAPNKNQTYKIVITAPQSTIELAQLKTMYENIIIGLMIKHKLWNAKRKTSDIGITWKTNYTSSENNISIHLVDCPQEE